MKPWTKGALVAAAHIALILTLGGKLLVDRQNLPRVWVKTRPFDPELPIRGRYLSLQLEVESREAPHVEIPYDHAGLSIEDGKLVARTSDRITGVSVNKRPGVPRRVGGRFVAPQPDEVPVIQEPVAYFIPQYAQDPSRSRPPGEELWVEVTIPKKGPPRPIQLGIKKDGKITPLNLK